MKIYTYQSEKIFVPSSPFFSSTPLHTGGITIFPFGALDTTVELISEISTTNGVISAVCDFSRKTKGVSIVCAQLKLGSLPRQSAIVANKGELVEIADSCCSLPPFAPSSVVKIFRIGSLSCALLVGNDAFIRPLFFKVAKRCNLILSLPCDTDNARENLIREYSDEANIPLLYCSPTNSFFSLPMMN